MFEDLLYETNGGVATITINRPKVRNAVRPKTYEELTEAMKMAGDDPEVGSRGPDRRRRQGFFFRW